jgi:indolepyruvate ferredoxin oxidoreductase beta subunit
VDALELARKAGNVLTQNIVLIGALAATEELPIKTGTLEGAIKELVPTNYIEVNLRAFNLGYDYVKSMR